MPSLSHLEDFNTPRRADPPALYFVRLLSSSLNSLCWYQSHYHTSWTSAMAPELRFNSYGIPYLVEFANVSFRSLTRSRSDASSKSGLNPSSLSSVMASTSALSHRPSSMTLRCMDEHDGQGLYIQYGPQPSDGPRKLSPSRVARLKRRIATAVVAAGMDSSPATEISNPMDSISTGRASRFSIQTQELVPQQTAGSLFQGTYGQVMSALNARGLTTVPCKESGFDQGEYRFHQS